MSVQFEDNTITSNRGMSGGVGKKSTFANFLIGRGIASNESEANKMLLGIAVLFFILSLVIFIL